jgi:hypothetical protein
VSSFERFRRSPDLPHTPLQEPSRGSDKSLRGERHFHAVLVTSILAVDWRFVIDLKKRGIVFRTAQLMAMTLPCLRPTKSVEGTNHSALVRKAPSPHSQQDGSLSKIAQNPWL